MTEIFIVLKLLPFRKSPSREVRERPAQQLPKSWIYPYLSTIAFSRLCRFFIIRKKNMIESEKHLIYTQLYETVKYFLSARCKKRQM